MKYRSIGDSDLSASVISLGGNIFGHFCDLRESTRIIDHARGFGVNCIDTADVYSDGASEEIIGAAIQSQRTDWIVCSKVGLRSHADPVGLGSKQSIFEKIENSLRRLRTDYIDIYQLHAFDPLTPVDETVAAFATLITQGKIRYFGLSNCSTEQLGKYLGGQRDSKPVALQTKFNLLEQEAESAVFPVCEDNRIGILAYGVLARGVLGGRYAAGRPIPESSRAMSSASIRADLDEANLRRVDGFKKEAELLNLSLPQYGLYWALRRSQVSSAILGMRSADHLTEMVSSKIFNLLG